MKVYKEVNTEACEKKINEMVTMLREYSELYDKQEKQDKSVSYLVYEIMDFLYCCGARDCEYKPKKKTYYYYEVELFPELEEEIDMQVFGELFIDANKTKNEDAFKSCARYLKNSNILAFPELREDNESFERYYGYSYKNKEKSNFTKNSLKQIQVDEIIKKHKIWLDSDKNKGEKATFIEENLQGISFANADLRQADFHFSNLESANFENAVLIGADIHGTTLTGANFEKANLSGADLSGSYIYDACFTEANLTEANFWRSALENSDLSGANLHGASLLQTNMKYVDLHGADLYETSLPLGYGGTDIKIDDRQVKQILYHLVTNVACSEYISESIKKQLLNPEIVMIAMQYHRAKEYERIDDGGSFPI